MKGDNSRETFSEGKHYSAVRQQQGRVQVDADWNEQVAIQQHHDRNEATDVIGPVGVPEGDAGFEMAFSTWEDQGFNFSDFNIGTGRLYLDGILCEQDDSGAYYCLQPHLPRPPYTTLLTLPDGNSRLSLDITDAMDPSKLQLGTPYVFYADVWDRHVSWAEDPTIREIALGGPDTATRVQTIWQVKIAEKDSEYQFVQEATLSARTNPHDSTDNLCDVSSATGYRGLENQLYRVEIHEGGRLDQNGAPTFKWSRDNGSVAARWLESVTGANTIRVEVAGGSVAERFPSGSWIELTGDERDLAGRPGILAKVSRAYDDRVEYYTSTVRIPTDMVASVPDPATIAMTLFGANPRLRRWDGIGDVVDGDPMPGMGEDTWLPLEDGVEIQFWLYSFRAAMYYPGQYWLIPARTATHTIDWPADNSGAPQRLPPLGINHHYAVLAEFTVNYSSGSSVLHVDLHDRRPHFCPLTRIDCEGSADLPMPGQYRCYQVDCDNRDDSNAVVGIADNPQTAVDLASASAQRFETLKGVADRLPRTGNDSIAIILIGRGTGTGQDQGKGEYLESASITGLTGYRRVIMRGSDYTNDANDKQNCAAKEVGKFLVTTYPYNNDIDPYTDHCFNASLQGASLDAPSLEGARLTFIPNPINPTYHTEIHGKTLTIQSASQDPQNLPQYKLVFLESVLKELDNWRTSLMPGFDMFRIDVPGISITDLSVQAHATTYRPEDGEGYASPIVLAGLRTSIEPAGLSGFELSLVQSRLSVFPPLLSLQVAPFYHDEAGDFAYTNCAGSITLESQHGDILAFTKTVLTGTTSIRHCKSLRLDQCFGKDEIGIYKSDVDLSTGAFSSIVWDSCTGKIQQITALSENASYLITVTGMDSRMYISGLRGGIGTNGVWLYLNNAFNSEILVDSDLGRFTDFLMADGIPYDPHHLSVSDVRDSSGNHIQGSGGCLISTSGYSTYCSSWIEPFRLISLTYDSSGVSHFYHAQPTDSTQHPVTIVGVSQHMNFGGGSNFKLRLVNTGFVAISVDNPDAITMVPTVVQLASDGKVGINPYYQTVGVLVEMKTTADGHIVGIVALKL